MRGALLSAAAAALAVAALAGVATGGAGAATKTCKNTYGGDVIRAKELKCKRARAVVRAWATGFKVDGEPDREALGFRCSGRNEPHEGLTVKCTRSGKRVVFYANVP